MHSLSPRITPATLFFTLLLGLAHGLAQAALPEQVTVDRYFLSARNPVANADQRDIEIQAMRLMQAPEVKAARAKVEYRWRAAVRNDPTPEAWALFDEAMEEYAFNFCVKVANSDPNYPKVSEIYSAPHEWFGMKVPGTRLGGDNPDNSYRLIPIDGSGHYQVRGQRFRNAPADVTYTLVANFSTSKTLASLEGRDVKVDGDGRFTLTLGPEPANGRANHIQTRPGSLFLFIRDSRGDWRQMPNALTVKRLDRPSAPPLTEKQMAERAAEVMVDEVPITFWWTRLGSGGLTNTMNGPFNPGVAAGGLVSQVNTNGLLHLNDDEAVVITIQPAGAAFRDIVLQDTWYRTIKYWDHTSSMNNSQGVSNADGSFTYVVAVRDPGVWNWVDTGGLHDVMAMHRWQGLPRDKSGGTPAISTRHVKLSELRSLLPKETRWMTPEERRQQLAERREIYQLRWLDR